MESTEARRVAVIHEVAQGQLTGPAAAVVLGLSERQVRRLVVAYRHAGAGALRIPMVTSLVPMVTRTTVPPCFSVRRKPSSTALAAAGSSSWGTPLRTMRLLLASISMMTVLAGITLPHTTTFNVSISLE